MTDTQAAQIKELRLKGAGYRSIASMLSLSRDTVRNYCKANGMDGFAQATVLNMKERLAEGKACICCGKELVRSGAGRPRRFCSEKCRRQWWQAHPEAGKRMAVYMKVCTRCGIEFEAYGDNRRKYCSHNCYIKDRFWRDEDGV